MKNTNKINKKTSSFLVLMMTSALTIVLLTSPLIGLAVSKPWYTFQFQQLNVAQEFATPGEAPMRGDEIVDYLKGDIPTLDPSFFSEQAIVHMDDVLQLLNIARIASKIALLLLIIGTALFLWTKNIHALSKTLYWSSRSACLSLVLIGGIASLGWDDFFVRFHKLIFSNDLWLFPPEDTLVRLLPDQFFMNFATASILGSLFLCLLTYLTAKLLLAKENITYTNAKKT